MRGSHWGERKQTSNKTRALIQKAKAQNQDEGEIQRGPNQISGARQEQSALPGLRILGGDYLEHRPASETLLRKQLYSWSCDF